MTTLFALQLRTLFFALLLLGLPSPIADACANGSTLVVITTDAGLQQIRPIAGGVSGVGPDGRPWVSAFRPECLADDRLVVIRATDGVELLAGTWTGSLTIESAAPVVIAEEVRVERAFTVRAPEIRVAAPVDAPDIALLSTGRLWIDSPVTAHDGRDGGQVVLDGQVVLLAAPIAVDGIRGGRVTVHGDRVLGWQPITANGAIDRGGTIVIRANERYLATIDGGLDASGASGGLIKVSVGSNGRLAGSGAIQTRGVAGQGGEIWLDGGSVVLAAATLDVSGETGGGTIVVGETAQTTELTTATIVRADALASGDGGTIRLHGA